MQYRNLYTIQNILKMTINNIENQIRMINAKDRGTTLCGILIDYKNQEGVLINIGDS